jgi:hypothetical protein
VKSFLTTIWKGLRWLLRALTGIALLLGFLLVAGFLPSLLEGANANLSITLGAGASSVGLLTNLVFGYARMLEASVAEPVNRRGGFLLVAAASLLAATLLSLILFLQDPKLIEKSVLGPVFPFISVALRVQIGFFTLTGLLIALASVDGVLGHAMRGVRTDPLEAPSGFSRLVFRVFRLKA